MHISVSSCTDWRLLESCPTWSQLFGTSPCCCCCCRRRRRRPVSSSFHPRRKSSWTSLISAVPPCLPSSLCSLQTLWLVKRGIHSVKCPCEPCQWLSMHNTRFLALAHLNGMQQSLMLWIANVLFLLWRVKMSSDKRLWRVYKIYVVYYIIA